MMKMNQCDYGHNTHTETRLLPIGGGGNLILCYSHYLSEKQNTAEMVRNGMWEQSEIENFPQWVDLKIYAEATK